MKIVFFSMEGDCGVTSNMSAICVSGILDYQMRILAMENHFSTDGIAQCLFYENDTHTVREKEVHYLGHGMEDSLVMHMASCTNKKRTDIMTIEVIQNSLYYMPQNAYLEDVFDYEFYFNVLPKLKNLENAYEYVFIDTKNYTMNSRVLLEEADLVVVNLKQDIEQVKQFFTNYSSIVYKSFFLISNYHSGKSLTIPKIRNEFHISKEDIIAIPHNQQFKNAVSHGKVINYMYDYYSCVKQDQNYMFMRDIKRATRLLFEHLKETHPIPRGGVLCQ